MNIVQFRHRGGDRAVALVDGDDVRPIRDVTTTLSLATIAMDHRRSLIEVINERIVDERLPYDEIISDRRLLTPIDHPDPAHLLVTGTGLTHLGSASTRDSMHVSKEADLTDSMKMFNMGIEGGRPEPGQIGVQPEWFYKGDGSTVVAPEEGLTMPDFALDGGEEPELAGIYVIAPDGTPYRLGYALGNEFSDHVMERRNYLYLAHSKLRPSCFGPEIRIGDAPADIRGTSTIRRDGEVIWQKDFLSGETNMSHTLANLEHHHFKYDLFRRPGDVHVHYFGTATLSFADGIKPEPGDMFEVSAPGFGRPLRNNLARAESPSVPEIRQL